MGWNHSKERSLEIPNSGSWTEYLPALSAIPMAFGTLRPLWLNKHIKKAMNCFMACGDKWTRTTDSRIFSPMLYQLSYITLFVK